MKRPLDTLKEQKRKKLINFGKVLVFCQTQ